MSRIIRLDEFRFWQVTWTTFTPGQSGTTFPRWSGLDPHYNVVRPVIASGDTEKVQRLLDHTFDNTSEFCVLLKTVSLRKVKIVVFKEEINLKVYTDLLLPALRRLYVPLFIFI